MQYFELTQDNLNQGNEYPNIQELTMQFFKSNARVTVWTDAQMRVTLCRQMRPYALLWVSDPRACVKESGKNSGLISPQSLMNLMLCRSAEAGF